MPFGMGSGIQSSVSDHELLLKTLNMGQMINEMHREICDLRRTVEQIKQGSIPVAPIVTPPPAHVVDSPISLPTMLSQPSSDDITDVEFTPAHDIDEGASVSEDVPLNLEQRERQAIVLSLSKHQGNRKKAAQELGVSERTLYRRIKDLGL